jgi:hypothetical protein
MLVNTGCFIYFILPAQYYCKPLHVWPLRQWGHRQPGTVDEHTGWTAGRDVAKALAGRLLEVLSGEWPEFVCVQGSTDIWHDAVRWAEECYGR